MLLKPRYLGGRYQDSFYCVEVAIKLVLDLVNFAIPTFTNDSKLGEIPRVAIVLKVR